MEKMRIKRLLTICLALMLSVSMLPAGTFALTEADAASDQNQTSIEATGEIPDNNGEDKLQTDTATEGVLDNRESDPNDEGNKGSPQPAADGTQRGYRNRGYRSRAAVAEYRKE